MLEINFNIFPTLYTQRLLLKQITMQDANEMLVLRGNETAMKYIDRPIATTIADVEILIQTMASIYNKNEGITWAICLKENAKLIGTIGFWSIDKQNYRAKFGYMLHPQHHQQGIMNEAFAPIIKFAFNESKLHSLEAHVNPQNAASKKLLLKNKFVLEAHFKENYFYNGQFLDSLIFSLVNTCH